MDSGRAIRFQGSVPPTSDRNTQVGAEYRACRYTPIFTMWLNGVQLTSSKETMNPLKTVLIDKPVPGIGPIKGTASIYEKTLTGGKSDQIARSNGFFVRVRNRVINLEDELFGLEAQNHSAWSRFALEVDADGLRDHLLSSREGVRESDATRAFRQELRVAILSHAGQHMKRRTRRRRLILCSFSKIVLALGYMIPYYSVCVIQPCLVWNHFMIVLRARCKMQRHHSC